MSNIRGCLSEDTRRFIYELLEDDKEAIFDYWDKTRPDIKPNNYVIAKIRPGVNEIIFCKKPNCDLKKAEEVLGFYYLTYYTFDDFKEEIEKYPLCR